MRDPPPPARPFIDAAREVTRLSRAVIEQHDESFIGDLLGALLVSAGHAACAMHMDAQEFSSIASRYYAHAARVRRRPT